jgi:hypothetical protein
MMIIVDMTLLKVMEPALNDVFPENSSTLACTTALPPRNRLLARFINKETTSYKVYQQVIAREAKITGATSQTYPT